MPDPCPGSVAGPSVRHDVSPLSRVLARHRRCLEMAEFALTRARSDESRATLADIAAFHRLRIAILSRRLRKEAAGAGA